MKNRITAVLGAVMLVVGVTAGVITLGAVTNSASAVTCTAKVKQATKTDASVYVGSVDYHNVDWTLFVNYNYCVVSSTNQYATIESLDYRVTNYTHSGECNHVTSWEMNSNVLGGWNPNNVAWSCVNGKDVYTFHKNAPDGLLIHDDAPSSDRCIGANLLVRISTFNDWSGSTNSVCVV